MPKVTAKQIARWNAIRAHRKRVGQTFKPKGDQRRNWGLLVNKGLRKYQSPSSRDKPPTSQVVEIGTGDPWAHIFRTVPPE